MHMECSTHMHGEHLGDQYKFLIIPLKDVGYPYSLETVSMALHNTILCIVYFQNTHDQISLIIYLYNNRNVRCPWNMLHNESSI